MQYNHDHSNQTIFLIGIEDFNLYNDTIDDYLLNHKHNHSRLHARFIECIYC